MYQIGVCATMRSSQPYHPSYNVSGHPPFSGPLSVSPEAAEGMTAPEIDEILSAMARGSASCSANAKPSSDA